MNEKLLELLYDFKGEYEEKIKEYEQEIDKIRKGKVMEEDKKEYSNDYFTIEKTRKMTIKKNDKLDDNMKDWMDKKKKYEEKKRIIDDIYKEIIEEDEKHKERLTANSIKEKLVHIESMIYNDPKRAEIEINEIIRKIEEM